MWSVAWLGVGSARPSFLFGSHFLFSVWGVGEGDLQLDQEIKEAQNQGMAHSMDQGYLLVLLGWVSADD